MSVTERTYQAVAVEDPERRWELDDGLLVEKPRMGNEHSDVQTYLGYCIPDVAVIPIELFRRGLGHPGRLEFYSEPMPFAAEIWSQSTGRFDVDEKLPAYRRRGDREVWRLHPYERTLTAWRRQPDGSYTESTLRTGIVTLHALPGVSIDLDDLFDLD